MFKLLIVEDDITIRKGLVECVQWKDYGIEIIGEASNGRKALAVIESGPVDIVLTDVVMPQMDGIELVRRIREKSRAIKIVFASGHSDLLYLKEAFKLDVLDYIIKPVIMEELDAVFKKITGICKEEQRQQENLAELKSMLEESMPVLRERFAAMLLKRSIPNNSKLEERIRFLGLPFQLNDQFTVLSIDLGINRNSDTFYKELEKQERQISCIHEALKPMDDECQGFSLVVDEHVVTLIISSKNGLGYERIINISQGIQQAIAQQTGNITAVGIGKEVEGVGQIYLSFVQSRKALEQENFFGSDAVIHINDLENTNIKASFDVSCLEGNIIEAIRLGKRDDVEQEVDNLFKKLSEIKALSMQYVRNICLELLVLAEKKYLEMKLSGSLKEEGSFSWEELLTLKTIHETHQYLKNKFVDMAEAIKSLQSNTSRNLVRMMMKELNELYSEDITINTLAEEFYITSNYVCLLFKKETGKTVNEYLTEVRMEKAKEFLENPVLKIYEIAEKVGYKDVDYFGKLFKKYSGLTLTQYRSSRPV